MQYGIILRSLVLSWVLQCTHANTNVAVDALGETHAQSSTEQSSPQSSPLAEIYTKEHVMSRAKSSSKIPAGPSGECILSGDPHIQTFDSHRKTRRQFHPMHAPGHWWLVRTQNHHVQIQAIYGGAGFKGRGGWQDTKFKGIPRTATNGIAFGGFMLQDKSGKEHKLTILPPCDWDYDKITCRNGFKGKKQARMVWSTNASQWTFNARTKWVDEVKDGDFEIADPPVKVTGSKGGRILVTLPNGLKVKLQAWGYYPTSRGRYSHWNVHIFMPRFDTMICGHCGDFDGDYRNDFKLYEHNTGLKTKHNTDPLCDSVVFCKDRLFENKDFGSWASKDESRGAKQAHQKCDENKPGVPFTISQCKGSRLKAAHGECGHVFKDLAKEIKDREIMDTGMADCALDACLDPSLAKGDAIEAKEEQKEIDEALKR